LRTDEILLSNPGFVMDMYMWKNEYDATMNGVKITHGAYEDGGDD